MAICGNSENKSLFHRCCCHGIDEIDDKDWISDIHKAACGIEKIEEIKDTLISKSELEKIVHELFH